MDYFFETDTNQIKLSKRILLKRMLMGLISYYPIDRSAIKIMPEIAKQQQQGLLQQANNPMMQQMGKRPNMQMQMPNAQMAARQGLLRQ